MDSLLEKSLNFNSKVKVNFNGGDLTSDSGLILYNEFDERIGFSKIIKNVFKVNDYANHRKHKNEEVLIQKIYQNIASYTTDDNSDELRYDPTFTTILGKKALSMLSLIVISFVFSSYFITIALLSYVIPISVSIFLGILNYSPTKVGGFKV